MGSWESGENISHRNAWENGDERSIPALAPPGPIVCTGKWMNSSSSRKKRWWVFLFTTVSSTWRLLKICWMNQEAKPLFPTWYSEPFPAGRSNHIILSFSKQVMRGTCRPVNTAYLYFICLKWWPFPLKVVAMSGLLIFEKIYLHQLRSVVFNSSPDYKAIKELWRHLEKILLGCLSKKRYRL